jgi:hypothetical protein
VVGSRARTWAPVGCGGCAAAGSKFGCRVLGKIWGHAGPNAARAVESLKGHSVSAMLALLDIGFGSKYPRIPQLSVLNMAHVSASCHLAPCSVAMPQPRNPDKSQLPSYPKLTSDEVIKSPSQHKQARPDVLLPFRNHARAGARSHCTCGLRPRLQYCCTAQYLEGCKNMKTSTARRPCSGYRESIMSEHGSLRDV